MTSLTSTSVTLTWDAPIGPIPVVSYRLLGVFNGIFVQYPLNYLNIYTTTYTVTGLTPGTALLWGVCAVDSAGNISANDYLSSLVINPLPTPAALSAVVTPPATSGGFQFTMSEGGSVLQTVLIQASTNPADSNSWVQIGSLLPATNPFTFTDTDAAQYPMRFYRIAAP